MADQQQQRTRETATADLAVEVGPAPRDQAPSSNQAAQDGMGASSEAVTPVLDAAAADLGTTAAGFDFSGAEPMGAEGFDFGDLDATAEAALADQEAHAATSGRLGPGPTGATAVVQGGNLRATGEAAHAALENVPAPGSPRDYALQGVMHAEAEVASRNMGASVPSPADRLDDEDAANAEAASVAPGRVSRDIGVSQTTLTGSAAVSRESGASTGGSLLVQDNGTIGVAATHTTGGGTGVAGGATFRGSANGPATLGATAGVSQTFGQGNSVGGTVTGSFKEGWNEPVETKAGTEWTVVWVSDLSGAIGTTGGRQAASGRGASIGGTVGGGQKMEIKRTFPTREAAWEFYRDNKDDDPDLSEAEDVQEALGTLREGDELSSADSLTLGGSASGTVGGVQVTAGHTDVSEDGVAVKRKADHFEVHLTTSETDTTSVGAGAAGVGAAESFIDGQATRLVLRVPLERTDVVSQLVETGTVEGVDRAAFTVLSETTIDTDGRGSDVSLGVTGINEQRLTQVERTTSADGSEVVGVTGSNIRTSDGWFENASIEHANLRGVAVDGEIVGYTLSATVDGSDNEDTQHALAAVTDTHYRGVTGDERDAGRVWSVQAQVTPAQLAAVEAWLQSPEARDVLRDGAILGVDAYITDAVGHLADALASAETTEDKLHAFADLVKGAGIEGLRWLKETVEDNGAGRVGYAIGAKDAQGNVDDVFVGPGRAAEVEAARNAAFMVSEGDEAGARAAIETLDRLLEAEQDAVATLSRRGTYPDVPFELRDRRRAEASRHVEQLQQSRDELTARGFVPRSAEEVAAARRGRILRQLQDDAAYAMRRAGKLDEALEAPERGNYSGSFIGSRAMYAWWKQGVDMHGEQQALRAAVDDLGSASEGEVWDFDFTDGYSVQDMDVETHVAALLDGLNALVGPFNTLRDIWAGGLDWPADDTWQPQTRLHVGGRLPDPWPSTGRSD